METAITKKVTAAVIGATGYVGEELMRLLTAHPGAHVTHAVSKSFAGKRMRDIYPNFYSSDIVLEAAIGPTLACDYAFLCLPHGQSMAAAPQLAAKGIKVIDLSGDFRYGDTAIYEEWYGLPHSAPALNRQAVYGLPEFFRKDIAKASFTANPGCYTTTSILALAPLLQGGLIKKDGIVIDAKSGVTGAGRKETLAFSYCETADNFKAYSVVNHRHTSEIEEQLTAISGKEVRLLFTPHLLPVRRGILVTAYADIAANVTSADITAAYAAAYRDEPFTQVLEAGSLPELKHVVGSNNCMIGFELSERTGRAVVVSCTDNLLKGAAGQAVQNFNIMNGFPEETGLSRTGWYL